MGKITVNDGPSSNTPYWQDEPVAEEPEPEPEPEPAPKPAPRTRVTRVTHVPPAAAPDPEV